MSADDDDDRERPEPPHPRATNVLFGHTEAEHALRQARVVALSALALLLAALVMELAGFASC